MYMYMSLYNLLRADLREKEELARGEGERKVGGSARRFKD